MRAKQVHDLSDAELDARLRELEEELFGLQLKRATSQLENPMKMRLVKRDIARVKTVQRQRLKVG
ncbi:MAG: 50S ribosomal protein L29 [Polyangiaceae bacterium UTPRO1]|nr:50S ribosomal protein L29 [Myxococcales bacterium]OQY65886.1 MAG: 50S ribosomal protein L29 [Polyangiaceae bacterium UTPRO1]